MDLHLATYGNEEREDYTKRKKDIHFMLLKLAYSFSFSKASFIKNFLNLFKNFKSFQNFKALQTDHYMSTATVLMLQRTQMSPC